MSTHIDKVNGKYWHTQRIKRNRLKLCWFFESAANNFKKAICFIHSHVISIGLELVDEPICYWWWCANERNRNWKRKLTQLIPLDIANGVAALFSRNHFVWVTKSKYAIADLPSIHWHLYSCRLDKPRRHSNRDRSCVFASISVRSSAMLCSWIVHFSRPPSSDCRLERKPS